MSANLENMKQRQENLLKTIIVEHIKNPQPIGSKLLADKFGLSSATLRSEMADLEQMDFLTHPHTSAGRVPTEKGYQYYLDNFLTESKLPAKIVRELAKILKDSEQPIKSLAKSVAEFSGQAVIVAFTKNDIYYTGISNLFCQPEFSKQQLVFQISRVIDHLDEVVYEIFHQADEKVKILIGENNPFGVECASLLGSYDFKNQKGFLGILGPMRMDYSANLALINSAQRLLKETK